jgi:hypothetical protein
VGAKPARERLAPLFSFTERLFEPLETFFSTGCAGALAAPFFGWGACLTGGFFAVGAVFEGDLGAGGFLLPPVLMSGFFFEAVTLPFLTRGFGKLFTGAFFSWAGFFAATLLTGFSLVFLTNDLEGFTPFL